MKRDDRFVREFWFNDLENFVSQIPVQRNPNESIRHLRPHYTDDRFKDAKTVYLARGYTINPGSETVNGAAYNYSDRYWQQKRAEMETAYEVAKEQKFNLECAATIEMILRVVDNDPELKLVHIMAGFNVSNGYDYQVYGFIPGKKSEK